MKITIAVSLILWVCKINAQTIPDSLKVNWHGAGFEGAIPAFTVIVDVTSFGAVPDDSIDDHPAVMSVISSFNGTAGVVYFPPGNYIFHSSVNLPDSIVLRGSGSDSTTLSFNLNNNTANAINIEQGNGAPFIAVNSGFTKDSRLLIVAGADTLFSPGNEIEIRQANGSWDTEPASWADYSVGHLTSVDSLSGDTLWMHDALRIDFDPSSFPEIRPIENRKFCGIECLKMIREDGNAPGVNYGVNFSYAKNCWMTGVESQKSICAHAALTASSHVEISGCYFHEAYQYDGSGTRGYGVVMLHHACANLVEDNIFRMLRHAMILKQGANGNVFGYNYSRETNRSEPIADYAADLCLHGHYAFANLFEGNVAQNLQIDQAWGPSGPHNTFFRNKIENYGIIMSSGTVESDRQNFVGNDVSNNSLFHGLYLLEGSGHFEFGNNIRGTITPNGTNTLPDITYYLDTNPPAFWNIAAGLPSIGIPNSFAMDINPALQRYVDGGLLTVCHAEPDSTTLTIHEADVIESFRILNCFSGSGNVFVNIESQQQQPALVEIYNYSGARVLSQHTIVGKGITSLRIEKSQRLASGIYLVRVLVGGKECFVKIAVLN